MSDEHRLTELKGSRPADAPAKPFVKLAVVVPTFKERDNILPFLDRLEEALRGIAYEVLFVDDDSPDGTASLVREVAQRTANVRVLQRIGRRGLASACIEGMLATPAPYIAVMDADMQHDERALPEMLARLESERLDVVVGSRHVEGGSMGSFSSKRVMLSNLGKRLGLTLTGSALSDPMSGFFVLDRSFLEEVVHGASGVGFKILLDLVASARRPVRFAEVPYTFRNRVHGESKLDAGVALEYLFLLADKTVGRLIPVRFVLFTLVGGVGYALYVAVVGGLYRGLRWEFQTSLLVATLVAMTLNFALNNIITYRDMRLRGWALLRGLLVFYIACGIGALSNLVVARSLLEARVPWYLACTVGLVISAVWNFGVTSIFAWRVNRVRREAAESSQAAAADRAQAAGQN